MSIDEPHFKCSVVTPVTSAPVLSSAHLAPREVLPIIFYLFIIY